MSNPNQPRKRRQLETFTDEPHWVRETVAPASQRVLAIPELLSLIFGFLSHSDISPTTEEEEDAPDTNASCYCPCTQCLTDDYVAGTDATGVISLPSPFSIPTVRTDGTPSKDESEPAMLCHCQLPVHRQLSSLFDKKGRRTKTSEPNRPSFNFVNALVCRQWSPIALDALWRVVDRPERLFSFLDGSWGTKPTDSRVSDKLRGLKGLYRAERGFGRMPDWWEPGVKEFLDLPDDEDDDEEDDESDAGSSDDEDSKPRTVRRREYELYSFRSAPTPASWARFDRYARRVRHLIYTRPCLSDAAMNHIAVTRPRLSVLPRLHTLTWADNPLNHAVLFMHEGVKRLELRIEVFGREKVDPHTPAEQTSSMYSELGLDSFTYSLKDEPMSVLFGLGGGDEPILPNKTISRTLATQLAEIPRRMPNIQTLCLSSFIPISLYLPALLCTLFRVPPKAEDEDEGSQTSTTPCLRNLRRLVIPRSYTCAPVLEQLASFPQLEVLEYQFDDSLGWGRANDVGLGKCVPPNWRTYEAGADSPITEGADDIPDRRWFGGLLGGRDEATTDSEDQPVTPVQRTSQYPSATIFPKLYDLSLTIPLTDARKLLLSSPDASSAESSNRPHKAGSILKSTSLPSSTLQGLPCWPQNLVCLYLDAPPGLLASPLEIRELIQAIALACYGPSTGRDTRPARLEKLCLVCSADSDSGYEALCGTCDDTLVVGSERRLGMKVIEPLLELLHSPSPLVRKRSLVEGEGDGQEPEEGGDEEAVSRRLRPKFALKSFEITHHFPMALTQADVECIAERWGGCIEKLTLSCEPVAGFGITGSGTGASPPAAEAELDSPADRNNGTNRLEATLTLAALLPFARYCSELRHLGLFIDASRGVHGLMEPIIGPSSHRAGEQPDGQTEVEVGDLDIDLYTAAIARRYLKVPFSHDTVPNAFPVFKKLQRLSLGTSIMPVDIDDLDLREPPSLDQGSGGVDQDDATVREPRPRRPSTKERLMDTLRNAARARMLIKKDDKPQSNPNQLLDWDGDTLLHSYIRRTGVRLGLLEEDEIERELGATILHEDSSSLVPLFLAQILPCLPAAASNDTSSSKSKPDLTSSAFTTIIEAGTTWSGSPTGLMASAWAIQANWTVGEPFEAERERQRKRRRRERRRQQEEAAEGGDDNQSNPQNAVATTGGVVGIPNPDPASQASASTAAAGGTSTLVIPFAPPVPCFSEPLGYLPYILASVYRARVKKWITLNETVLPTAVADRKSVV